MSDQKAMLDLFAQELKEGLSAEDKWISSKWFYDERGDALFVKIMGLPEYYLTRAEEEIFSQKTQEVIAAINPREERIDLIELGAGDGSKTMHVLEAMDASRFIYRPIDISRNALEQLEQRVNEALPEVQMKPLQGDYFSVLSKLDGERKKAILFMGSNVGNMLDDKARLFLTQLSEVMSPGDRLLLGVDLKKPKEVVLPAYSDSQGITAQFNLNVLRRINETFDADFDLKAFCHAPEYDEEEGVAYSYLESLAHQEVTLKQLNISVDFAKGERIFTEVSRKYDLKTITEITQGTSLKIKEQLLDDRAYFCDIIFEKEG